MPMDYLFSDSAAKTILFEPVLKGANHLCILSAYATPSMTSWLLKSYEEQGITDITVDLIIESVMDNGIDDASHNSFRDLHKHALAEYASRFSCSYMHEEPSSKNNLFIWLNEETPVQAFSCSYDFTQSSLLRKRSGSLVEKSAAYAYKIYEAAVNRSIYCTHAEVDDYIVVRPSASQTLASNDKHPENFVRLPLIVKKTGEPGKKSGLNWGQRKGRNKNEAYIPLPRKIAKSGFFPLNEQHFLVVTDDHHALQLRVEQQNDKAITTPASNALLGEYFRNRLGLANGAYVHTSDLMAYGRTDVTFYKIDDEQYYMDFSPSNKRQRNG